MSKTINWNFTLARLETAATRRRRICDLDFYNIRVYLNIYLRSCMIQIIKVLRKHRKQLST